MTTPDTRTIDTRQPADGVTPLVVLGATVGAAAAAGIVVAARRRVLRSRAARDGWLTPEAEAEALGFDGSEPARRGFLPRLRRSGGPRRPAVRSRSSPHHVLILGAGFGGLTAAETLTRHPHPGLEVTLIDRRNYHLFTPFLYQISAGLADPMHIVYPARELAAKRGFRFRESRVESIDLEGRRVVTDEGDLPYDDLVIALGSTTNYFGITTAQEHALPLKTLGDAVAVRNRIIDAFETADVEADPERRRELLTFVIVGGGATGVELAGGLQGLIEYVLLRHYPGLRRDEMRILIMEAGADLLQGSDPYLVQASWDALRQKGIDVRLNARVVEVCPDRIILASGEQIPTRTAIWTAGVRPVDVIANLDVPKVRGGRLQVNEFLELPDHPGVFVVGDVAGPLNPRTGLPVPAMSATAEPQGHSVGGNILRRWSGRRMRPYRFHWYGQALSLGRNNAAIEAGPLKMRGFLAWIGWRTVHLVKMRGWRSRLGLAFDWAFAYIFQRETLRLETEPERG